MARNSPARRQPALVVALLVAAMLPPACGGEPSRAAVGSRAPAFSLDTLDGETFDSSSLQGDIVVINFWATWCAPCRKEIPELIEMADAGEVKIIGIALDEQGETVVRPFAETFEIDYPVLLGNQEIFLLFDGFVVPHTVLLDRTLTVRKMYRGPVTRATLEQDIRTFDATE